MCDDDKMDIVIREMLHVGPSSRVVAAVHPETGALLALKLPREDNPSETRLDKFRHEYNLLSDLQRPGIIRALGLTPHGSGLALVMERWGVGSLDAALARGPLPLHKALDLGARLARALGQVHRQGVIHRDVKPSNVLVDAELQDVRLIDFGLAVRRSTHVAQSAAPDALAGTLAYMAPEQTGRMNRSVDARADLYALGATLYQMLTGALLFELDDLTELIHAHIARSPTAPHERAPERRIPEIVSAIVLKLLAKSPDDRYQTGEGAAFDLEQAARRWSASGEVLPFELATRDWEDRLRKPSRLFGRERETAALGEALTRVAGGAVEAVFVAGPSGVGKSALVQALRESVLNHRGIFAPGKFDQLQRGTPHLALSQAFRSIVRRRLADSHAELARWKEVWQQAAGPNGRILIDLIPELSHVLNAPPPLAEVGPIEAKNRFRYTIQHFVRATATPEHPLVLFIDDLQWADSGSMMLLQDIMADPEARHVLLIGTYRDSEIDAEHAVHALSAALTTSGRSVNILTLAPLDAHPVSAMVADMLRRPAHEIASLAAVTKAKTDGSPFFVEQFVRALHERRLLQRDSETGVWSWDAAKIERAGATDNVVSLLAEKTSSLSPTARRILSLGACAGAIFEVRLIDAISGLSHDALRAGTAEILREGLVLPVRDAEHEAYEFVHDRVQRASYEALGDDERTEAHHALTLAMERIHGGAPGDAELFTMLHHHLLSLSRVTSAEQRRAVAERCLRGGQRARAGSTYVEAVKFLDAGQELLGASGWRDHFELTFETHLALADALWLAGRMDAGEAIFRDCFARATQGIPRTRVAVLWLTLLTSAGRFADATGLGLSRFSELGASFPEGAAEIKAFMEAQLERIISRLKAASLAELATWNRCTALDTEMEALLLARLGLAVGLGKPELLPAVAFAMTEHTLVHGVSRATAVGCGVTAMIVIAMLGDLELASRLVYLGRSHLAAAVGMTAYATHGLSIARQYLEPLHPLCNEWKQGAAMGREEGDLPFGSYCAYVSYFADLLSGHSPLRALPVDVAAVDYTSGQFKSLFSGLHRALTDGSPSRALAAAESWTREAPPVPFFLHCAHACAAILALHAGSTSLSLAYALNGAPHWASSACHPDAVAMIFSLCLSAQRHPDQAAPAQAEIAAHRARLDGWAAFTPRNFLHMKLLVDACEAWKDARHAEAERLFGTAIVDAHQNGFINDEALGLRLLGEYNLSRGEIPLGRAHLREAARAYLRWGTPTCAAAVREAYPELFAEEAAALATSLPTTLHTIACATTGSSSPEKMVSVNSLLDVSALLRATQALAGDMDLGTLVGRVLRLLATNAGAERGVLALMRSGELRIEAEIGLEPERLLLDLNEPAERSTRLPAKIVQYVERSRVPLVLGHAIDDNRFDEDPYLEAHRPASILAVPLTHQGRLSGVMYLEHSRAADAFPADRVEVITLLASQAATAVENATLYAQVKRKTAELQASNERLEQQVEERTAELRIAKETADAANRAKSDFLSSMSHELRTPLNGILGYAQVLERLPELPEKARDGVEVIKKSGNYLLTLINDVLDLAKIEAGRLELTPGIVGLLSLVDTVASLCRVRAEQKGIAFQVDIQAPASLVVYVDEKRLLQILLNLVGNAIKFTNQGSVQFSIKVREVAGARAQLCFRVQDTGPGIAEGHLRRIFQPFEQVGDQKSKSEGTGLGLAITKKIVDQMGGQIEVQSELGQGSAFTVTLDLPVVSGAATARAEAGWDDVVGYQGERRRVLVVDDTPESRNALRDLLAPIGFEVLVADSGEQALRLTRAHRPALVFMDLMMPGMDGHEATRRMRAMPELAGTVIIASSANASEEQARRSALAGADDFLPKPLTLGALLATIERHLAVGWIRRPMARILASSAPPSDAQIASLLRPSREALAQLSVLIEQGRVRAILEELDRLERAEPRCGAWLGQVRELAAGFQLKRLRQVIDAKSTG